MIWNNGTTYEGTWVAGKQEGLGKCTSLLYGVQIGIFKDNQLIKDQSFVFDGMRTGGLVPSA